MQDLTGRFTASLVPSSQEGGNMIQQNLSEMTMTAPGSEPVAPLPDAVSGSHPEINFSGPEIPVSHPGNRERVTAVSSRPGSSQYTDAHDIPAGGRWKETS